MSREIINVGTVPNDGTGDPLRTAYIKCNNNFGELYSRAQSSPPATLVGTLGDIAGMYAYDEEFFYYCYADYDGSSDIWAQISQVGNVSVTQIVNGTSEVAITNNNGNITVDVNGVANVAVFTQGGLNVSGQFYASANITAAGNITGGNITASSRITANSAVLSSLDMTNHVIANVATPVSGTDAATKDYVDSTVSSGITIEDTAANTTVVDAGGTLTLNGTANQVTVAITNTDEVTFGLPANVSASGNITAGNYVLGNGAFLTGLPATYGNSNVASYLNVGTPGNIITIGEVSATGNITTSGYFVGTFVGNVTGNFVVPGSNTQVLFNTSGNADAVGGFTYNKSSNLLTILGNVSAGNVNTTSAISAAGNVSGNYFIGNGSQLTGITTSPAGSNTQIQFNDAGTFGGTAGITFNKVTNAFAVSGNITSGNINATAHTGTTVSVTGNVTGGNLTTAGVIIATGNITGGNISATAHTGTSVSVTGAISGGTTISATGNVTGGNLITAGLITATGNVSGNYFIGNGSQLTGLAISYGNSNVSAFLAVYGTNIISSTGNITSGNLITSGLITATGNITTSGFLFGNASQLTGTYGNSNVVTLLASFGSNSYSGTGNVTGGNLISSGIISSAGNINGGSFNVAGLLSVVGNITGGNISATTHTGTTVSVTGNVTSGNVVSSARVQGVTVQGTTVSASGNVTGGNLITGGQISASGNITGSFILGNGSQLTGVVTSSTSIQNGASNVSIASSGGNVTVGVSGTNNVLVVTPLTANVTGELHVSSHISANGNITSNSTLTGGNITTAGVITVNSSGAATAIVNGGSNGAGNIGSSSRYFNTVFATASTALYADLAEYYLADNDYGPGTVLKFGGEQELTIANIDSDPAIAGVVSTNPAYVMNGGLTGDHVVAVALMGRTVCKVKGPVRKGQMMVTAGDGYARAESSPAMGTVIGKSLVDFDGEHGEIEVLVGRL